MVHIRRYSLQKLRETPSQGHNAHVRIRGGGVGEREGEVSWLFLNFLRESQRFLEVDQSIVDKAEKIL